MSERNFTTRPVSLFHLRYVRRVDGQPSTSVVRFRRPSFVRMAKEAVSFCIAGPCVSRETTGDAIHEALISSGSPLLVRSHASGQFRRHITPSRKDHAAGDPDSAARRRSAFRTPLPKQVWAPTPESASRHLGAGLLAKASPRGDPANPGIH